MNQSLADHYDHMWDQARSSFLEGQAQTDVLLDEPTDDRYGITLLVRPDQAITDRIQAFLDDMAQLEPEQYYYPNSDLHLTILSIISCYSGFQLQDIDMTAYATLIREVIQALPPFQIRLRGITASPSTVLIQGFPENKTLEEVRNRLREAFRASGLQNSIDTRYRIFTAHSTVIRFRKPLQHPEKFVRALENYRDKEFGLLTTHTLELVGNDWYQRASRVKLLETFSLQSRS